MIHVNCAFGAISALVLTLQISVLTLVVLCYGFLCLDISYMKNRMRSYSYEGPHAHLTVMTDRTPDSYDRPHAHLTVMTDRMHT